MEQQVQKPFYKKKWVIGLAIFFGIGIIGSAFDKNNPIPPVQQPTVSAEVEKTTTPPKTSSKVSVGEEGYVNVSSPKAIIASTESNYKELTKIYLANDTMGIGDFLLSGKGFSVPNGTKVLVVDSSVGSRKVRVLEGDSIGQAGWIAMEWVSKTK